MSKYPTLLFYPEPLKSVPGSRVSRICQEYKIPFHNDRKKPYDIHFFWSYTPKSIIPDEFTLTDKNVVNRGCWDIGKVKVNDVFDDISIDPKTYHGVCVEKLDMQGHHNDHKLISCPSPRKDGYVYQKYIKAFEDDLFVNNRIYYGNNIDYVIKQYKKHPFSMFGDYVKNEITDVSDVLTEEQVKDIVQKCSVFGFNYGDIDFLMDNGTPIVIDINNVTGWPYYTKEIRGIQDSQFLTFIKRHYDKTG